MIKKITLVFLIAASVGITKAEPPSATERKEKIKQMEAHASPLKRKERSETLLRSQGVPINKSLPAIETESEAKRRTKEEVAFRALALLMVALKGEGLEQPKVEEMIKSYGLDPYLTPKEKVFIKNANPSEQDRTNFTWRYEGAWVLLWALGYIEDLGKPNSICDVPQVVQIIHTRNTKQFIEESRLRSLSEILDEADLIYRYDWAVVDARVNKKKAPTGLDPGVVYERHYALNWLIGYMDEDWDDITTDT